MIERRQYNNPWAEKLSQVSLPDSGESWRAMEAVLDRRMPTGWRRGRRRWLLLILLLLLLIGVCNCPGRRWFSAGRTGSGSFRAVQQGGTAAGGPSLAGTIAPPVIAPGAGTKPAPAAGSATYAEPPAPATVRYSQSRLHHPTGGIGLTGRPPRQRGSPRTPSPEGNDPEGNAPQGATPQGASPKGATPQGATPKGESSHFANSPPATPNSNAPKAGAEQPAQSKKSDSLTVPARKPVLKDSAHKKPAAPPKEEQKTERNDGWMVGIGLNQFFRVGGQQASSFNSSGITGTLSDYIPVPMVRYYFNPKLYVQLEAQFNTPQYTKKNLVISQPPLDSISGTLIRIQSSASLQQLFYFNVPLSVHYEVVDNLDLGVGLQFSRLSNAIGTFDSSTYSLGSPDTANSKATKSFKGDTLYQQIKTGEFRFLLDASYTYKHFILGLRYNQALSKFINVQIAPGQVTESRNSSLQLYLRYILWDGRKKKPLLPAK
jgi:hypothetical protein